MKKTSTTFAALGAMLVGGSAFAAAPNALVTTEWVAQNLQNPKVRVIEVSVDPGVYEKGHVPGAVGFKWHTDLVDTVRRDIIPKDAFEKLNAKAGIANDTTVVIYGDNDNWFAAWAVWTYKMYGHKDVKLMDGGRKKWEAEKRPVDAAVPSYAEAKYKVGKVDGKLRARLADVVTVVEKKKPVALVDVRSADEFAGKVFGPQGVPELSIRAGRIPGAKNISWKKTVNEDGTFKSVEDLKKLYADAGITEKTPVVTYCRIGERSSHSWFVLHELLGYKDVKNYDGSWTEYGNAVGVPIENESGTVWTGK
jgi:thiosulfate/3-mercaptopyruvate sulfurtransferase